MKTKDRKRKSNYASPFIKVIEIKVEKGFALSDGTEYTTKPIDTQNYLYRIHKVNDGGRAF